ncbi:MAG: FKBP-type peptidyl-prolyl cis-trans isomerase [Leucobacter sp.]
MKFSRVILPAALAAALLTTTACSAGGDPNQDASGSECLTAGDASKAVKVSGKLGEESKLTSKTPVRADEAERSVLTEGSGDVVADGDMLTFTVAMMNGATGEILEMPTMDGKTAPAFNQDVEIAYQGDVVASDPLIGDLLRCATEGQRAVAVVPLTKLLNGQEPKDAGLPEDMTEKDSIVVVTDTTKIGRGEGKVDEGEAGADDSAAPAEPGTLEADDLLKRAEGKAKEAPEGFPEVKLGKDGTPEVIIPKGVEAPEELKIATLIEGDGETVKPGDRVYANYRGVIWRTGKDFDSSWGRGTPLEFITDQVVPGFTQAVEGQKVGSQVIALVPEDAGYGEATASRLAGAKEGDVLVFVIDILGVVHAE